MTACLSPLCPFHLGAPQSLLVMLLLTYNNQSFKHNGHDFNLKEDKFESKRGYLFIHDDVFGNFFVKALYYMI